MDAHGRNAYGKFAAEKVVRAPPSNPRARVLDLRIYDAQLTRTDARTGARRYGRTRR
jgi:hypothetical protein